MAKGEIAPYEQFLLFPQCFQKGLFPRGLKRCHWEGMGYALDCVSSWVTLVLGYLTYNLTDAKSILAQANFLFRNFSPLTVDACKKSRLWLSCDSTGLEKPGNFTRCPDCRDDLSRLQAFSPFHTMFSKGFFFKVINSFPNKPWFLRVCSTSLLKTLWEKEKLLVMSNFSFSNSVFYLFRDSFCHFRQIWNCRLQTFLVWKSLKFVIWS